MAALPQPATVAERALLVFLFRNRPAARKTFEAIRAFMATCGPMALAPTRSRISFLARTRFLWVQEAHLDGSVTVGFLLPYRLDSPRLRAGDLGSRWSHHTKVSSLDPDLRAWFREAYTWDRDSIQDRPGRRARKARSSR